MLTLVPGRADAEHRPAAGQHVERRHDLGQQARVAVGDARDDQAKGHALCLAGEEAEGSVALEHRVLRGGELLHLEPVIHQRERRAAAFFSGFGGCRQGRAERFRVRREG